MPPDVGPAINHDDSVITFMQFFYSCIWNVLNFTAGVLPVTLV